MGVKGKGATQHAYETEKDEGTVQRHDIKTPIRKFSEQVWAGQDYSQKKRIIQTSPQTEQR